MKHSYSSENTRLKYYSPALGSSLSSPPKTVPWCAVDVTFQPCGSMPCWMAGVSQPCLLTPPALSPLSNPTLYCSTCQAFLALCSTENFWLKLIFKSLAYSIIVHFRFQRRDVTINQIRAKIPATYPEFQARILQELCCFLQLACDRYESCSKQNRAG